MTRAEAGWWRRPVGRALALIAALMVGAGAAPPQRGRPLSHPDFADGIVAYEGKRFAEAASKLRAAEEHWAEDGQLTRAYDRWFGPYAPTYFRGLALAELGCPREALELLNRSALCQRVLRVETPEIARCEATILRLRQEVRALGVSPSPPHCSAWSRERGVP